MTRPLRPAGDFSRPVSTVNIANALTLLGISAAQAEVSTVVRVSEPTAEHHLTVLLAPSACVMHLDGPRS